VSVYEGAANERDGYAPEVGARDGQAARWGPPPPPPGVREFSSTFSIGAFVVICGGVTQAGDKAVSDRWTARMANRAALKTRRGRATSSSVHASSPRTLLREAGRVFGAAAPRSWPANRWGGVCGDRDAWV